MESDSESTNDFADMVSSIVLAISIKLDRESVAEPYLCVCCCSYKYKNKYVNIDINMNISISKNISIRI